MSEEQVCKEVIEQVGYQEFYRYFQEKTTLIEQQRKEIERLNNIINEALGIANERVNHYSHINKKDILEDWKNIFDVLVERDNQELKGSDKE